LNAVRHSVRKPILLRTARNVATVHRWLGIGVGFMFAVWFATGTVLSFCPFPELEREARLAGSEPVDLDAVRVTPAAALAAARLPDTVRLRLISVDGRPRYVLSGARRVVAVDATNGTVLGVLGARTARTVAATFAGFAAFRVDGPIETDTWTVHDRYASWRPFYRVSISDPDKTVLYVAAYSGEVVQRTRRVERAFNRVGALVHWLNIGSLRQHYGIWHATIRSLATIALFLAVAGLTLGIIRWINLRRQRGRGVTPYRGLLRWHHLGGLVAAVVLLNWITSGWLSLDEGSLFSSDRPSASASARLRGLTLQEVAGRLEGVALPELRGAREIEFGALGGLAYRVSSGSDPRWRRLDLIDAAGRHRPARMLPDSLLKAAVETAWSPWRVLEIRRIAADDAYALRSRPFPSSARRLVLDDPSRTWVHIDAADGNVISVMDSSRRTYRWLVDGLHRLDFPWLNRAGQTWHVLLVACTMLGFAFSCTGIVLAARRVRAIRARRRTVSTAGSGASGKAS
jgi:hypothetical protein